MSASPVSLRLFAGMFIVTASFIPGRAKAQNEYREPRNAEVDARGARSVRIEAEGGSLRVEGHQGISQVRVRGTARTTWRNRLDDIKLVAERRGDVVLIKADIPDNDGAWRALSGWTSRERAVRAASRASSSRPRPCRQRARSFQASAARGDCRTARS